MIINSLNLHANFDVTLVCKFLGLLTGEYLVQPQTGVEQPAWFSDAGIT